MPGYKYPNIDSEATPIGSAGRAPDRLTNFEKEFNKKRRRRRRRKEEEILSL
jgi:hypothetical protein